MVSRGGVVSTAVHLLVIAGAIQFGRAPDVGSTRIQGPAIAVDASFVGSTGGEAGPRASGPSPRPVRLDLQPIGVHLEGGFDPGRLAAGRLDPRSFVPRCDSGCDRRIVAVAGPLEGMDAGSDSPPKLVFAPPARYPEELRQGNVRGAVAVEFVVDRSGRVERGSLSVRTATDDRFIAPALESVAGERFTPGRLGGVPARTRVRQVVMFDVS
ncbi:MAG TPA: TonB family protein [Gemmatimonadales bacterium]|nr:TonB family protein [Gemmatimonadales bacterium]